jgi:TonB family protein
VPAAALRQELPPVPAALTASAQPKGLLEVVIDEQGRVIMLTMRESIHPGYDQQVFAAARDWKYQPATLNAHPVRFRKLIQIAVKR